MKMEKKDMSGNKYKILIIEDEENIRNFIKTVLVAHGYQEKCFLSPTVRIW